MYYADVLKTRICVELSFDMETLYEEILTIDTFFKKVKLESYILLMMQPTACDDNLYLGKCNYCSILR